MTIIARNKLVEWALIGVALRVAKELRIQDLRKLEIQIKSKTWVGTQAIVSSPVQNYLTKAVKTCAKRNTEVFWSSPVFNYFLTNYRSHISTIEKINVSLSIFFQ